VGRTEAREPLVMATDEQWQDGMAGDPAFVQEAARVYAALYRQGCSNVRCIGFAASGPSPRLRSACPGLSI
jgi:hypothetical protein